MLTPESRPFEVGQGRGIGGEQTLELATPGELESQQIHQRHMVSLQDAEKRRDVARPIVDHFGRARSGQ